MTNTPHTALRIPHDLKERIRLRSKKEGVSMTELMLKLAENYCDKMDLEDTASEYFPDET
jgi:predicted DNA-binding protein